MLWIGDFVVVGWCLGNNVVGYIWCGVVGRDVWFEGG